MNAGRYFCFNDRLVETGTPVITPDNRSFRYGDGFFETMRMFGSEICLKEYHFERLFSSLELLKFENPAWFTAAYLEARINDLVRKNGHEKNSRIRLNVFRGDGGLLDTENNFPNVIIQTWKLEPSFYEWNKDGLLTDIYNDARKTSDGFSHIKSNNYLPYLMAAKWAQQNKLNDAIILNNFNRVAEATVANIFLVHGDTVKTPALAEGCV